MQEKETIVLMIFCKTDKLISSNGKRQTVKSCVIQKVFFTFVDECSSRLAWGREFVAGESSTTPTRWSSLRVCIFLLMVM